MKKVVKGYVKRGSILLACLCMVVMNQRIIQVQAVDNTGNMSLTKQNMRLWYDKPANINTSSGAGAEWERETLPIGNGNTGGLIFGGITKERVHINEKTLWSGGPSKNRPNYNGGNIYDGVTPESLEAYREKLDDKSKEVFPLGYNAVPYARNIDYDMGAYQDFGDLYFDFSPSGVVEDQVSNYVRDLDLDTAIASSSYTYKGVTYKREYFASYPDQVMVMCFSTDKMGALSFDSEMKLNNGGLSSTTSIDRDHAILELNGLVNDNGLKFNGSMKIVPVNGKLSYDQIHNKICVRDADEVYVYVTSETDYKNEYPVYRDHEKDVKQEAVNRVNAAADKGYTEIRKAHLDDYQKLYERVDLNLGEGVPNMPTDLLIQAYRKGTYSNYLESLAFQYGRYLSIQGSRGKLPSNLSGMWSVGNATWNGDFHFNVNVQMNYWPVYSTNLAEIGDTFTEYMESIREPGRITAKQSHGIVSDSGEENGFVVHTQNNPFGMTAPSDVQEYGWNVTGASWAMQNVYEEFQYTQDKEELRDKIYPMIKETAKFWDAYLWYSPTQDRLVVSPSFSAEHGPVLNGSTYDQSLVWQVYEMAIEAANELGVDEELVLKWKDNQAQLDPIMIGSDNEVKEWYEQTTYGKAQAGSLAEINVNNFYAGYAGEHRHISHLIGLYPGTIINKDQEDYINAAKTSLLQRGFDATGWSKAHKLNAWARTGDGDYALKQLRSLVGGGNSGLLDNLLDSHGSGSDNKQGSIYQIEGNFGLTAGVAEMLLQSQLGYVQFLPALPSDWQNGYMNGLVARGNFTIDQSWKNGYADEFKICYTGDQDEAEFTGEYLNIQQALVLKDGKVMDVEKVEGKSQIRFMAEKGSTYTISFKNLNQDVLKEQAQNCLSAMPDALQAIKEELTSVMDQDTLGDVLQKAVIAKNLYIEAKPYFENVYYLSNENEAGARSRDEIYNAIMDLKAALIQNTATYEQYIEKQVILRSDKTLIDQQIHNNVISFSKESGLITPSDRTLTLRKHADVMDYDIHYVTDEDDSGVLPSKDSPIYTSAITLPIDKNVTVRAVLYKGNQPVSGVFTKRYVCDMINIKSAQSMEADWGDTYAIDKMIDDDVNTRWATKDPKAPCYFTLTLDRKQMVDTIQFDTYVSNRNSIDTFDVQYEVNGEFKTIYQGSKMASKADDPTITNEGHVVKAFSFTPVETSKIRVIMHTFVGEPSFWEVRLFNFQDVIKTPAGNTDDLEVLLDKANAIDKNDEEYIHADPNLKLALSNGISDCNDMKSWNQIQIDARYNFIANCLQRLGYGERDTSGLVAICNEAELELKGEYDKDSLYILQKTLYKAYAIIENESLKQPVIEAMIMEMKMILNQMTSNNIKIHMDLSKGSGHWAQVPSGDNTGFYYTNTLNAKTSYTFTGSGIKVMGVTGADHGILRFTISNGTDADQVYDVDCYQKDRNLNANLLAKTFPYDTYTVTMELIGKQAASTNYYVEYSSIVYDSRRAEPDVHKDVLRALIEQYRDVHEDDYTQTSYAIFSDVLQRAMVVEASDDTCNAEVKDLEEALKTAYAQLEKKPNVDTTALTALLQTCKDIAADGYTYDSYQALQQKIAEIEAFLTGHMTQSDVDAKLQILQMTLDALQVDKSELQKQYDIAAGLDLSRYTPDSVIAFQEQLRDVKAVIDDIKASIADVQQALQTLTDAYDMLVLESAEFNAKEILQHAILKAEALDVNHLAPKVKELLDTAIQEAKQVYDDASSEEQCLEAWLNLANAMHYADFKADKTILKTLIDICKELHEADYSAGFEAMTLALNEAQAVDLDINALQNRIDQAYTTLLNAYHALIKNEDTGRVMLAQLVELFDALDQTKYCDNDAWSTFVKALNEAKRVLADETTTVSQIHDALLTLKSAYENIRLLPSEDILNQLKDFLDHVGNLDVSLYEKADITRLMAVAGSARMMLQNIHTYDPAIIDEITEIYAIIHNGQASIPTPEWIDAGKPTEDSSLQLVETIHSKSKMYNQTQTGDETNVLWTSILLIASAGTAFGFYKKQKKTK